MNTAIAEAVTEHAHKRKPDLVVLASTLDVIAKPDFIGPHKQKSLNTLRVPVLSITSVGVHSPDFV